MSAGERDDASGNGIQGTGEGDLDAAGDVEADDLARGEGDGDAGRRWIDISLPIDAGRSIAWSGIGPPEVRRIAEIGHGDAVNVGRLDCCLHTGTHADAPWHVGDGLPAIHSLDPGRFVGPALVVRTRDRRSVGVDELRELGVAALRPRRLLVATPSQYDGLAFPEAIPHLEPEAARFLAGLGVGLVGVNTPSVDPLDSRTLDAHHILFGAGAYILENLWLTPLSPGWYDLVAPPIAVTGGDAAPVRALARPRGPLTPGRGPRSDRPPR